MQEFVDEVIRHIKPLHRKNQFAIKMQSRIDRSMEAFIRVYVFDFKPELPEAEREAISKKTTALIKQCRAGTAPSEYDDIADMVSASDASRAAWDKLRKGYKRPKGKPQPGYELFLKRLARKLPAYQLVKAISGAGALGFAQLVGEADNLSEYPTEAKLWKRFGLAPYRGLAMSTWRREKWRQRAITQEEWKDEELNLFFKPARYAIVFMIAASLLKHQKEGRDKKTGEYPSGTKYGEPKGRYGEIYVKRRERTELTHPDWTAAHAHKDALRIMVKEYISDLWSEWRRAIIGMPERAIDPLPAASLSQAAE